MRLIPKLRPARIAATLAVLAAAASLSAQAADFRPEREALSAGQTLVDTAASRDLDAAFAQASTLARADDAWLNTRLDAEKLEAAESAARLGAVSSVSAPEEMFFAGCRTRTWFVRYAEGQQRWMLKYRRGVEGWYLSDLDVRG